MKLLSVNKFMLKKLKVITIVVSLLVVNVFANAFAGISVFTSLNFGNGTISSINMVKQCSQIAMMPSKFSDMCIMLEKELTNFDFSSKKEIFITKKVIDNVQNCILFINYRVNTVVKYCVFCGVNVVKDFSVDNFWLFMFLIMISFITGYLGLLTAKNKINNITMYIQNVKLCPILQ